MTMKASRKQAMNMNLSVHVLIFQYDDVPGEWHVVCLETNSFGSGPTPEAAFDGLKKTLEGQLQEALKGGARPVFGVGPDPEWLRAYREGKHPAHPNIAVAFRGSAHVAFGFGRGRPKVSLRDIDLESPIPQAQLQPA